MEEKRNGVIVLNKPTKLSSFFAVRLVQRAIGAKKAGHMGTLDPLADGVLVIGINKGTKLFDKFLHNNKIYRTIFKFGEETTTLDSEGEIINKNNVEVSEEDIKKILPSFIGKQFQMPPKFSAKKINGKKACDLARLGVEFELQPKEIEIFDLKLIKQIAKNTFEIEIFCSSGFYVRSFARDLAKSFETFAYALSITRIKCGDYDISMAQTLEQIKAGDYKFYEIEI